MNFGLQTAYKLDLHFCPPSVNSAFYYIAMLRRRRSVDGTPENTIYSLRNSTKLFQTVDVQLIALTISRRKVGVVAPEKNCGQKLLHLFGFRRFSFGFWLNGKYFDLMANIFWMKRDIDNRGRALETTKGLLYCPEISWTLVHKRVKIGPEFSRTLREFCVLLCFIARPCTRSSTNGTQPNFAKQKEVYGPDASRIRWRRGPQNILR